MEIVEYLDQHLQPGTPEQNWRIVDAFRQIDSPSVRELLRKWSLRRGTPADPMVREDDGRHMSDMCFWELESRYQNHHKSGRDCP